MKTKWATALLLLLTLAVFARCLMPVDEMHYAILTRFGRVIGHPISQSGLHWKAPWDSRIVIDKRLQIFDPRPAEFLLITKAGAGAGEAEGIGQNVIVDYFVAWRVLGRYAEQPPKSLAAGAPDWDGDARRDGPLLFLRTVNNPLNAQGKLLEIIHSEISATLGRHDMSSLVSTNPGDIRIHEIEESVAAACRDAALRDYGIEIEDVRIKRVGLPEQNKQSVFQRMRAERMRKATQLRAEGQRDALRIRAEADKEASSLLADAYRQAELIRGQGDAEAAAIYAAAHNKDPQFYRLTRTLDAYKAFLKEGATVVLSADSELLRLLGGGVEGMGMGLDSPAIAPESAAGEPEP
ncbi:MAG: Modulator of FtsH protease HflC [candidate division BRC1 bacterium ADurb.BinA364]|nr:MAG: Modulator of FtsH protease HflC [candidate division BRC1 bacterium ADurb.BinA364]